MADVTLKGFDELANSLDMAAALFVAPASRAIAESLLAVQEIIEVYPPQPPRDRAATFNTYVRGRGQYPRSAFIALPGGGHKIKRTAAAKIRMTSQQMDKRFRVEVVPTDTDVTGTLKNTATYSGWVLGSEDQGETPHQVAFHAETGWVSRDAAIEQAMPAIDEAMNKAIDEFLAGLAGV